MKKYCALMLVLCVVFAFVSCGEDEEELEYYISFKFDGKSYAFGWAGTGIAYQSDAGTSLNLSSFSEKDFDMENPQEDIIGIGIIIGKTDGTWENETHTGRIYLRLKKDGPWYLGEDASVTIDNAGSRMAVPPTPTTGEFAASVKELDKDWKVVTNAVEIAITEGKIKLVREGDKN